MDEIMEKQEEEMLTVLEVLEGNSPDTEEYTKAVNNYKTLVDAEVKRREIDVKERESQAKLDSDEESKKTEVIWKVIDKVITLAGIAVNVVVPILGMRHYNQMTNKLLHFEQTGNILVNPASKNHMNKMNPYKKL